MHWAKIGQKNIHYQKCETLVLAVLLTIPKIQTRTTSHSGDCLLEEDQLYVLPLLANG